jgi:hypothetical protein
MAVVFQIEVMFNSLLYIKFVVAPLMPLLIVRQLFDDVLLFALVTTILMSLVVVVVAINLMYYKYTLVVVAFMQLVAIDMTADLMEI